MIWCCQRNAGGGAPAYTDDSHLEDQPHSLSQRQRLLQGTATLEDDSRRLEESNRLALETEDIGADILRDLRGQREQIEHSRDTVSLPQCIAEQSSSRSHSHQHCHSTRLALRCAAATS